ncbi:hypothetical protein [Cohnella lupini]|jgi:hypothetical protein|uniref:Uncharacterized protein n=1 Tax=Cohnella lupini TaxID=1294267 RepID=A0A3D9IS58_9BACL|nr:hypothetical protein [Cohnella lupini]RED64594.1 hypothetical protein DFP95_1029 [Cohnella lupini]
MGEEERITSIQIYQFDNPHGLHYGTCKQGNEHCQYGLLRITCCGHTGWAKCTLSADLKKIDLVQWASFLQNFRKPTLEEAYETVNQHRDCWGIAKTELVREALNDLDAHLHGKESPVRLGIDPNGLLEPDALIVNCLAHYENL